jgi:hypothetical protein
MQVLVATNCEPAGRSEVRISCGAADRPGGHEIYDLVTFAKHCCANTNDSGARSNGGREVTAHTHR